MLVSIIPLWLRRIARLGHDRGLTVLGRRGTASAMRKEGRRGGSAPGAGDGGAWEAGALRWGVGAPLARQGLRGRGGGRAGDGGRPAVREGGPRTEVAEPFPPY
jgi:hypothetical protein